MLPLVVLSQQRVYIDAGQIDDCMYDNKLSVGLIVQMLSISNEDHHHADLLATGCCLGIYMSPRISLSQDTPLLISYEEGGRERKCKL